jgi:hypothetical protein
VICSAVLGRRHGEHNLFPPPLHSTKVVFAGGDKRNPVQCLGDAATVEQGLPHSQGIVTRMVLPLFFLLGCPSLSSYKEFFSALYLLVGQGPHTVPMSSPEKVLIKPPRCIFMQI